MKRNTSRLRSNQFDVLIIGAGSHGACAARDAALRGLKVALIDKGDICGATSHNSLKTIHGGIRYLQHLNFKRTLESIKEQKIWLRTAPHLVRPIPFLMPTYGHGMRGPLAMLAGIILFRIFGIGRNKYLRADRKLLNGSVMSRKKCLSLAPNIRRDKLTGGALWYDAQIEHADRAVMQISEHANELGAAVCNYVRADGFELENNSVSSVRVTDLITGKQFSISAKTVLNASGPWAGELLKGLPRAKTKVALVKSMNLVTRRSAPKTAVAVPSKLQSDSVVGSSKRLYLIVPWLDKAVVGTTHFSFSGCPEQLTIENDEILAFIDEINAAYPSLELEPEDVLYCYQGLAPAEEGRDNVGKSELRLHESKVIDHAKEHQIESLVSIFSIKWTTARLIAQQAVDLIGKKLGKSAPCKTCTEPLNDSLQLPYETACLSTEQLKLFCQSHIDHSMTVSLADLLLRRTNDTVLGKLSFDQIKLLAQVMQDQFQWSPQQCEEQLKTLLSSWLPRELSNQLHTKSLWKS